MLDVTVELTDTGQVGADLKAATLEAATAMAKLIYAGSQAEVPVDTGRLKESIKLEVRESSVAVIYGGHGVRYAAAVHEGVRGTGVKGQSVKVGHYKRGKSHYLRDPAMQAPKLLKAGAASMRKSLDAMSQKTYKKVRAVRNYGPGGR